MSLGIKCKHCDGFVPNLEYQETWANLLQAGWKREDIRKQAPLCWTCASKLPKTKEDHGSQQPETK